jgi:hypothetical protein
MAVLQGFCDFRCAERGELRGKTWWSCGESVVEITSRWAQLKHANFLDVLQIFLAGLEGRSEDRFTLVRDIMSHLP